MTKHTIGRLFAATLVVAVLGVPAFGQTFAGSGQTTLSVGVGQEASIAVNTATTSLTTTGLFANYTGTTSLTYKIRTGRASSNSGAITVQLTNFAGAAGGTGPTVGSTTNPLTYTCDVTTPATPCTGNITASTSAGTNVAQFGANARSAKAGNGGSLAWTLPNDPTYETDNYTAVATFTISTT